MVYERFQSFLELKSIASRRLADKLADTLDQEALEALRIARDKGVKIPMSKEQPTRTELGEVRKKEGE